MMDVPLTVTALMRYGTSVFADREVATWGEAGARRQSCAATGERAARLANALRGLGIRGDQRVATLLWNNAEHLEAYLAVPSMGAVLHPLNLRLDPGQLTYIANHAEDNVIIVDATLVPLLARVLPGMETVRHVLVTGPSGPTDPAQTQSLAAPGRQVHSYENLLAAESTSFEWSARAEKETASSYQTRGRG